MPYGNDRPAVGGAEGSCHRKAPRDWIRPDRAAGAGHRGSQFFILFFIELCSELAFLANPRALLVSSRTHAIFVFVF